MLKVVTDLTVFFFNHFLNLKHPKLPVFLQGFTLRNASASFTVDLTTFLKLHFQREISKKKLARRNPFKNKVFVQMRMPKFFEAYTSVHAK